MRDDDKPIPRRRFFREGLRELFKPLASGLENIERITHELGKLDGFSRVGHAFFYVDDASAPPDDDGHIGFAKIDGATLPRDEASCISDASSVFVSIAAPK